MVSEPTSRSTMWFENEPGGSWWACDARGRRRRGVTPGDVLREGITEAKCGSWQTSRPNNEW
ncbi:hypothetical protein AXF42_Ash014070 [Apostasia shenzhenica]|uniref:Uncharacterized protein n=1 Tax=Apostasia shenzhenica TaxID=1088818 RepID=A0A2I0A988_9ASPA|nr:hypothetical protein AXF42_Ash014070 [Apostasia shenzhenica]